MAQNRPVIVFRYRGISASVFENETYADRQPLRFFKVSLQRAYRQDGEYKHNSSFGRDDIPIAMHVLQMSWEFILEREAAWSAEKSHE